MRERLAMEFLDASDNKGAAVKKKEDTHRWPKPTRLSPIIGGKSLSPPRPAFSRGARSNLER